MKPTLTDSGRGSESPSDGDGLTEAAGEGGALWFEAGGSSG